MEYNPFETDFDKLKFSDLESLITKEIGEGWYIEYKSIIPKTNGKLDNIKISKSISSFANTKGGWIFWGITCDSSNKPVSLEGIDITEYRNFEDQISQIINSNISPKPFYHLKVIDVENGNVIIVFCIEESPTPPYITSQGVIYQRENNESKPIKDRYIIEKLNEKTNNYYKSIERFSKFNLPETKGQANWNQTYLELYLFPLPFNEFKFKNFYSSDFFKNVAVRFYQNTQFAFNSEEEKSVSLNLGFNSIYSSERSIIIRPISDSNLIYKSTTVELFDNGNLKFLIPLHEFKTDNIPAHYENSNTIEYLLNKYSPYDTFYDFDNMEMDKKTLRRVDTDFVNHVKFIDGHELILTIMIIVTKYKSILEDNDFDFKNEIGFRTKISDCWRKFVFFDNEDYLEKLKLYNIPLSPKSEIEIPEFKNGNYYVIDLSENYSFIHIARNIMEGIGLPDSQTIKYYEIINKAFERYFKIKNSNDVS
ncbi:ATP-binding protein [Flavobacterium sp. xlx-214]|uniref:AlbA family DNA-binding domain-containing protein n=1 Tax=unclassified Flavobacterium TaxID=196869 RepID=UPI0013D8D985|nr:MULTISPECIES: ATP-binding protein [unclassified Flavobacterium]MBA5793591.1 ATP-binding protein [Flavobacterium sp. xlx-221]QMI84521.1 ATP-binding protein [Flavobacterium sp. xlx-214]